jgi:hypothetical protein
LIGTPDILPSNKTTTGMAQIPIKPALEPLTGYIPEEVDWPELQKRLPFPKEVNETGLNYILAYMVMWINFKHKKNYRKGVPINSIHLKKLFRKYNLFIKYLVDAGIILLKEKHKAGINSRKYDFTKKYRGSFKQIVTTDARLLKCHYKLAAASKLETAARYPYLTKWFNEALFLDIIKFYTDNLSSGVDAAQLHNVTGTIEEVGYLDAAIRLSKQQFSFVYDASSGRLHTSISSIKKVFRKYLHYNGMPLGQADLKASQIYFLTVFLNSILDDTSDELLDKALVFSNPTIKKRVKNTIFQSYLCFKIKEDVLRFNTLLAGGQVYEYFQSALIAQTLDANEQQKITRTYAKDALIQFLFARNNSKKKNVQKLKPIFKAEFPTLHTFFFQLKLYGHSICALLAQSLERHYMLDILAWEFSNLPSNPNPPCLFSLHDALITTLPNLEQLQQFLSARLTQLTNIPAVFEINKWNE